MVTQSGDNGIAVAVSPVLAVGHHHAAARHARAGLQERESMQAPGAAAEAVLADVPFLSRGQARSC